MKLEGVAANGMAYRMREFYMQRKYSWDSSDDIVTWLLPKQYGSCITAKKIAFLQHFTFRPSVWPTQPPMKYLLYLRPAGYRSWCRLPPNSCWTCWECGCSSTPPYALFTWSLPSPWREYCRSVSADGEEILSSIAKFLTILFEMSLKCALVSVFCAFVLTGAPRTFISVHLLRCFCTRDVMLHVCCVVHTTYLSACRSFPSSNTCS